MLAVPLFIGDGSMENRSCENRKVLHIHIAHLNESLESSDFYHTYIGKKINISVFMKVIYKHFMLSDIYCRGTIFNVDIMNSLNNSYGLIQFVFES